MERCIFRWYALATVVIHYIGKSHLRQATKYFYILPSCPFRFETIASNMFNIFAEHFSMYALTRRINRMLEEDKKRAQSFVL